MGDSSISKSGSPPPTGWVELTGGEFSKVSFVDVKQQYYIGEDIIFHVQFPAGDSVCKWDKVYLTAFGRTHEPSYISFIGMNSVGVTNLEVKFTPKILPKKTEFYQFLYLRGNVVLGASPPFFLQSPQDDALSVSSEDDFLVVHQAGEKENDVGKDAVSCQDPNKQNQVSVSASCEASDIFTEVTDANDVSSTSTSSDATSEPPKTSMTLLQSADSKGAVNEPEVSSSSSGGLFPGISGKEMGTQGNASVGTESPSASRTYEWLLQTQKISAANLKDSSARNPAVDKLFGPDVDKPIIKALKLVIKKEKEKNNALGDSITTLLEENNAFKSQLDSAKEEIDSLKNELKEKDEEIKNYELALENERLAREVTLKEVVGLTCTKNLVEKELTGKTLKIQELVHALEELRNAKPPVLPCMVCSLKDEELQSMKAALDHEKKKSDYFQKEALNQTYANKSLELDSKDKDAQIEVIFETLETLQKEKESLRDQISNLTRENDILHKENQRKASLSTSSCSAHVNEIEDVDTMLQALEASKVLAVQEIKAQKVVEGKLRNAIESMKKEYDVLNEKVHDMREHIKELKDQESVLKSDNENLKAKERILEERVKTMSASRFIRDSDLDKALTIEGMHLRLAEAAKLYKQQFMEIRSLKKQLRKLQKHIYQREGMPASSELESTADETVSSAVSQRSDSDTGEFIKTMDGYSVLTMNAAYDNSMAEPRPAVCETALLVRAAALVEPPPPYVEASAPPYNANPNMEAAVANREVPPISGNCPEYANNINEPCIAKNGCEEPAVQKKPEPKMSAAYGGPVASRIHCPYCEEEISFVDDEMSPFIVHLHEKHQQLVCPICGVPYDAKLPIDYFQLHVESHF